LNSLTQLGVVVHAYSATQEAEIGEIKVRGQPGQKVSETPVSINKLGVVVCTPVIPATWEV
jgi:hypothetical protein